MSLITRLNAEADQCANDGAADVAKLLWQSAEAMKTLAESARGVVGLARLGAARLGSYKAAIDGLDAASTAVLCDYPDCAYPCDLLPDCNDALRLAQKTA